MIPDTLSTKNAQKYYDTLGVHYDWFSMFEAQAKQCGLQALALTPGQRVLNLGVGTGREHEQLQKSIQPGGLACGLDISPVMLSITRQRTASPLVRGDVRGLPFVAREFDRIFAAYVLDLIPLQAIPGILDECRRVLRPGGRLVVVALTEGVDSASRTIVGLWKLAYAISPITCGGCRPLQIAGLVAEAGFAGVERQVVTQLGVPSEVVSASRPD